MDMDFRAWAATLLFFGALVLGLYFALPSIANYFSAPLPTENRNLVLQAAGMMLGVGVALWVLTWLVKLLWGGGYGKYRR